MSEKNTPQYEIRRRSKNYVGLWEGEHCLAAICIKRSRGVADAQLLLRVCNAHEDLLAKLRELSKNMQTQQNNGNLVFSGWLKEPIRMIEAAIKKAETEDPGKL